MALTGIISGIGGESPRVGQGRDRALAEAYQRLNAQLAIEGALQNRRRLGMEEESQKLRMRQANELIPIGQPIQQPDGSMRQVMMNPQTGQVTAQTIPNVRKMNPEEEQAQTYKRIVDQFGQDVADRIFKPPTPKNWIVRPGSKTYWEFPPDGQGQPHDTGVPIPPRSNFNFFGGGGGGGSELIDFWSDKLANDEITEDDLNKFFQGKEGDAVRHKIGEAAFKKGWNPQNRLSSTGSKEVQEATAINDSLDDEITAIERLGLQNNNENGFLFKERLKYLAGEASEAGQLGDEIANLELDKIIAAAQALKGSSRSLRALEKAMTHTPNTWVDSPRLIYTKLKNIKARMDYRIKEAQTFGTKSGLPNKRVKPISTDGVTGTIQLPGQQPTKVGGQSAPASSK